MRLIDLTPREEVQATLSQITYVEGDRMAVLYHKECNDGLVAAAVVIKFLVERGYPVSLDNLDIYPITYDNKIPNLDFTTLNGIFVVDFAFPGEVADGLIAALEKQSPADKPFILTVDHHKSAVEDLLEYYGQKEEDISPRLQYVLSTDIGAGAAGANLTWQTLFPNEKEPDIVADVADRDTWRFTRPNSKPTYWGLQALALEEKRNPESILQHYLAVTTGRSPSAALIEENYDELVRQGESMMVMEEMTIRHITSSIRVGEVRFSKAKGDDPLRSLQHVMWVNCPYMYTSNTAEWLRQNHPDYTPDTVIILYSINAEKEVNISIRTENKTANKIAAGPFNGGGHANSAGGRLSIPSLNYWLDETQDTFGEDDAE